MPPLDHHTPDERFRNPWPTAALHDFRDFLRWRRERVSARAPDPDPSFFPRVAPSFTTPRAPEDEISVTWVGHSTVLIQLGGLNVLTDPIWSERPSPVSWIGPRRWVPPGVPLDALPPIDLVLLSHNHYDHLDTHTIRKLAARHPEAHWVVPLGLRALVERSGPHHISECDWWDATSIGAARVACTPAQHFSGRGFGDRGRTLWCGWTVRVASAALFFAGDTGYHPEFGAIAERYGPFDLVLLPIGAYEPRWFMRPVHVDPEEAVQAFRDIAAVTPNRRAPIAVGIHWGTFKLADEPMDEPPRRMRAAWRAAGLDDDQIWLLAHGETRWTSRAAKHRAQEPVRTGS